VTAWRVAVAAVVALGAVGCRKARPTDPVASADRASAAPDQEPPVALNGDSPIQYPPRLYDQKVEGDVVLRLYVDSTGRLAPESSRVVEASGYSALDSAALTGARRLRFAPARRHGLPIATAFLQPVEFRHPQAGGSLARGQPDTALAGPGPTRAPTSTSLAPRSRRARRARAAPRDSTVIARDTTTRTSPDTARVVPDSGRPRPNPNRAVPDSGHSPPNPNAGPH
jgi:TonB family protein